MKLLNVIDEFTRACPAILIDRRIDADAVAAVLDRLALERGVPGYVRFDKARNSLRMPSLTGAHHRRHRRHRPGITVAEIGRAHV